MKGLQTVSVITYPGYSLFPKTFAFPYFFIRQGIAYLQLTGRTVNGKPANYDHSSFEERARDILAGVEIIKARKKNNPKKNGFYGSTLGAWGAPFASTLSPHVA